MTLTEIEIEKKTDPPICLACKPDMLLVSAPISLAHHKFDIV